MKHEDLVRVKACRQNPKMKAVDIPSDGDPQMPFTRPEVKDTRGIVIERGVSKPGFLHTDSGVIFPSRSALKKAVRIAWSKPNGLRQVNKDRLHRALNQIIRANDMSIPEMVRAEIKGNVERSASSGAVMQYMREMVATEVQKALGTRAQITNQVKAWALDEAKRLVAESLTLEFRVSGDGMIRPTGSGRALRLQPDHE